MKISITTIDDKTAGIVVSEELMREILELLRASNHGVYTRKKRERYSYHKGGSNVGRNRQERSSR
jgi:hypothetical protein